MKLIDQRTATNESYKEHQQALKRPVGLSGTPTGFYDWDMVIGGWRPRKVNTIAMRSAMGKSATMVQISKAAGEVIDGRRSEILIASWEQAASEIVTRYVSWKTGFTIDQLNHPYIFNDQQRAKIRQAYEEAIKFPVHYHQYSTNIDEVIKTLDEFMAMIKGKEITSGDKIQPVFVLDYIGMAKGRTKYSNKTYDIADFLQELKAYSNTTGLCSLVLAQLNRSSDSKDIPDVSDISDSSSIENNSDVIILGHRPEKLRKELVKDPETGNDVTSKDRILWLYEKNRGGKTPHILGRCEVAFNRFYHSSHTWDHNYIEDYKDPNFWKKHL